MKNYLHFGIDIDGVIRDILSKMTELYNNRFQKSITINDYKTYDLNSCFEELKDPYSWFFDLMSYETFYQALPYPNAVEAMQKIHDIGRVTVITKQTNIRSMEYTVKWLYKNKVPFDNIIIVKNNKDVFTSSFDYFVDDYIKNIIGSKACSNILISQPYNAGVELPKNVLVKDSLYEFSEMFN